MTLSLFSSTESGRGATSPATQVLQPRRPRSKMFACAKLACNPALVRSPAGRDQGPTCWPGASTLLNGPPRSGAHRPLGTAFLSPSNSVSFFSFPLPPGAPHSARSLHQGDGGQLRPSCQAPSCVGQALLASRPQAAPSLPHPLGPAGGLGSTLSLGCCEDSRGLPRPSSLQYRSPLPV